MKPSDWRCWPLYSWVLDVGFPKKPYIKVLKSYGRFLLFGHRWHTHYNAPQACTVSPSFSVMQKTIRFALADVFIPGKSLGLKSYGLLSWKQTSDGSAAWHSNGHGSFLIDKQKTSIYYLYLKHLWP